MILCGLYVGMCGRQLVCDNTFLVEDVIGSSCVYSLKMRGNFISGLGVKAVGIVGVNCVRVIFSLSLCVSEDVIGSSCVYLQKVRGNFLSGL